MNIRRAWLGLLLLNAVILWYRALSTVGQNPVFESAPLFRNVYLSFVLISSVGATYLLYHCAYKKPGVKFLFFCLITTGACLVANPILLASGKLTTSYPSYNLLNLGFDEILGGVWFYLCWKMVGMNRSLKKAFLV